MKTVKYRTRDIEHVIAFSLSYQRGNLLARGMGLEHLRELLLRLARSILRRGASLAYGGDWKEREDNFTYDLLRLISAELEDNSIGGPDSSLPIGKLYNHSAWPHYLEITPRIEAQWIDCCRIVRITQKDAGIGDADIVVDADVNKEPQKTAFNAAVTLSAMRRLMMTGLAINAPDAPLEQVPAIRARVLLGGRCDGYSGFMPGVFEEALLTLEHDRPLYILGGFGGAAELLADALLKPANSPPEKEFTLAWHKERTPALVSLLQSTQYTRPPGFRDTQTLLDALFAFIQAARQDLSGTLSTGLNNQETRNLLKTRNIADAVRLIRQGLVANGKLLASG